MRLSPTRPAIDAGIHLTEAPAGITLPKNDAIGQERSLLPDLGAAERIFPSQLNYAAWIANTSTPADSQLEHDTPSNDGISNLLKYAANLGPMLPMVLQPIITNNNINTKLIQRCSTTGTVWINQNLDGLQTPEKSTMHGSLIATVLRVSVQFHKLRLVWYCSMTTITAQQNTHSQTTLHGSRRHRLHHRI